MQFWQLDSPGLSVFMHYDDKGHNILKYYGGIKGTLTIARLYSLNVVTAKFIPDEVKREVGSPHGGPLVVAVSEPDGVSDLVSPNPRQVDTQGCKYI